MLIKNKSGLQPANDLAGQSDKLKFVSENTSPEQESDATLEDAAQHEQDYLRQRLRDELKREPTETELNDWLRQHTEGY
ncbi:MAG: hypothetical protein ABR577_12760 [Pyrinomonadaceae bacterium]